MKNIAKNAALVILGNIIYSFAVVLFIEPSGLIMGGSTGLGLFAHTMWGVSPSLVVAVINSILFLLGLKFLGKAFAAKTLLSTIVFPLSLRLAEACAVYLPKTNDLFLCTVFGGIIIGISLGVVIRTGASTGGMDIPPLLLNKYFGIPVSLSLWALDITIIIIQAIFSDINLVMYGMVLVIIYTITLKKTLAVDILPYQRQRRSLSVTR